MEVYAAMIDRMDQGIGKIVAELEANGAARQHAHPLPARQRRLRGGDGPHGNKQPVPDRADRADAAAAEPRDALQPA